jgi:hypothetical protein
MDLSDERFHMRTIPWAKLEAEGVDARKVMKEAQKQKMWKLARKAELRWHNQRFRMGTNP